MRIETRVAFAERVALEVDTGAIAAARVRAAATGGAAALERIMPYASANVAVWDVPFGPHASVAARFSLLPAEALEVRPVARLKVGSMEACAHRTP